MKQTRSFITSLVACGVALAMVSTVAAQTAIEGAAKVVRIKGSARYTTGNGVWQPLKVGALLKPGTVVQTSTDKGSYVDLALGGEGDAMMPRPAVFNPTAAASGLSYQPRAEQNMVRVTENTVLGIDKLTSMETGADVVTETQLDLKAGRIMGSVKKMSSASKYEIKLPNGVAGIRGTVYNITAEGVVEVYVGSVVIAYMGSDGNVITQVVSAGQQFDSRTGQITPLSATSMKALQRLAMDLRFTGAVPPTIFIARDRTIYTVSPVRGGPPFTPPGPPPRTPPVDTPNNGNNGNNGNGEY